MGNLKLPPFGVPTIISSVTHATCINFSTGCALLGRVLYSVFMVFLTLVDWRPRAESVWSHAYCETIF